jgi:hypothetical protein
VVSLCISSVGYLPFCRLYTRYTHHWGKPVTDLFTLNTFINPRLRLVHEYQGI